MVQRLSLEELQKVCPTRLGCTLPISTYPPNMIAINTSGNRVACLVLMLPDEAIKAQGVDPQETATRSTCQVRCARAANKFLRCP